MAIKPYNIGNIKKVTEEEIRLTDALQELIPATSARDKLSLELRKTLMKHLGEKSFYYLDAVTSEPYASFVSYLPDTAILAVLGLEPSQAKVVVHIDNNLGFLLIDRLLGGAASAQGDVAVENRPLSETESGVLQYLIMQLLAQVWKTCGEASRLHFRFEKFVFSPRDIEKLSGKQETAAALTFKVGIGELSGFVKVIFPGSLLNKLPAVTGKENEFESSYFMSKIGKYDYVRTTIWADAGRATVTSNDIIMLEAGDVVIFDDTGLMLKGGRPEGEIDLRVGKGDEGSLRAAVAMEKDILKCTIVGA